MLVSNNAQTEKKESQTKTLFIVFRLVSARVTVPQTKYQVLRGIFQQLWEIHLWDVEVCQERQGLVIDWDDGSHVYNGLRNNGQLEAQGDSRCLIGERTAVNSGAGLEFWTKERKI